MNTYSYSFISKCPNNGVEIRYSLQIVSRRVIMVEDIVSATAQHLEGYHESIADALAERFPETRQTLRAFHHGVGIFTERGDF